jgi:hypothetical protein
MDKKLKRYIIILLVTIIVGGGLFGCAKPKVGAKESLKAMGEFIECMFTPVNCEEKFEPTTQEELDEAWEEIDEVVDNEN